MNERIFSGKFELFVFFHSRLFHTYFTFLLLSLFLSFLLLSLLLTRFSISFSSLFHSTWRHFCPHTPRLVTSLFFFFSLAIPALCARPAESSFSFISVAFIFPSHSTLTSLFVHSASFAPSLPLLYLFPGVLPASCAARPRLRYLSRFSTHVNARSLIFLGSLFLAFVPPSRASTPRDPLRDIFRFPFRYVRSVSDTWSVLPCLDIVLFCRAKCILLASPVFAPFFFPFLIAFTLRSSSLFLLKFLALRYFARWAILENTIRSIPSHYPR